MLSTYHAKNSALMAQLAEEQEAHQYTTISTEQDLLRSVAAVTALEDRLKTEISRTQSGRNIYLITHSSHPWTHPFSLTPPPSSFTHSSPFIHSPPFTHTTECTRNQSLQMQLESMASSMVAMTNQVAAMMKEKDHWDAKARELEARLQEENQRTVAMVGELTHAHQQV